jgi:hypothetical protein
VNISSNRTKHLIFYHKGYTHCSMKVWISFPVTVDMHFRNYKHRYSSHISVKKFYIPYQISPYLISDMSDSLLVFLKSLGTTYQICPDLISDMSDSLLVFLESLFIWNSALVQRENKTCKNSDRNITKRRTSQDTEVSLTRRPNNNNTEKYWT